MESSSATTPLPPGTPPPVPPGPSVVASGPVAATIASGSGDATERRKWKKMTAAECKTAGIDVDPIFQYIMEDLYPIFKVDIQMLVSGEKREDYVNRKLFPLVNAKFDIEGPNSYHTGDFKDRLYVMLKNKLVRDGKEVLDKAPPTAKKPNATNAALEFKRSFAAEVSAAMKAEFKDNGTAGAYLRAFNAKADKMYKESPAAVKEEMEAAAKEENDRIAGGLPPEHIVENQQLIGRAVVTKLKELMGYNWKGHSDVVFYVRGAFLESKGKPNLDEAPIRQFRQVAILDALRLLVLTCDCSLTVGPNRTAPTFVSSHEEETDAEFKAWAKLVLKLSAGDPPRLQVDKDSVSRLPEVSVDALSGDVIKRLIRGWANKALQKGGREPQINTVPVPEKNNDKGKGKATDIKEINGVDKAANSSSVNGNGKAVEEDDGADKAIQSSSVNGKGKAVEEDDGADKAIQSSSVNGKGKAAEEDDGADKATQSNSVNGKGKAVEEDDKDGDDVLLDGNDLPMDPDIGLAIDAVLGEARPSCGQGRTRGTGVRRVANPDRLDFSLEAAKAAAAATASSEEAPLSPLLSSEDDEAPVLATSSTRGKAAPRHGRGGRGRGGGEVGTASAQASSSSSAKIGKRKQTDAPTDEAAPLKRRKVGQPEEIERAVQPKPSEPRCKPGWSWEPIQDFLRDLIWNNNLWEEDFRQDFIASQI
ncbi:hypothetical protein B0H13DRAFT_1881706 [Mycena leptocephala]|nr:hypothetical protein B0H13DRAFT_1881706 [Mycena leptocephala]